MKIRYMFLWAMLVPLLWSCHPDDDKEMVVRLGAILDFSGDYSESGLASKAAIQLSIEKVNQRYELVGSPVRFACEFEDSRVDTSLALAAAEKMYGQGIRLLVAGPSLSAELRAIKSFVDRKNMLVLHSFSTAPALAIAGDNIFRVLPDDNFQGQALTRILQYDSIKALVPVWREDNYGNGLHEAIKQRFQNAGGTVMTGVPYSPDATNYGELMAEAGARVKTALESYDPSEVGVLLISLQDVAGFMEAAADETLLSKVKWYGCDGNVLKSNLITNRIAAGFATTVQFKAPIMGIGTASSVPAEARRIMDDVADITGTDPDFYCVNSYDAVQILSQAYNIVGSYDAALIKEILPSVCESYNYAGISRKLNEAGDLKSANYIFYSVFIRQSGYYWDSCATYLSEGDFILMK